MILPMASIHNIIDLTTSSGPRGKYFSDDEDEKAFGSNENLRNLYNDNIWRLKQNDSNFDFLELSNSGLPIAVYTRIGIYLWQSKHVKTLLLL